MVRFENSIGCYTTAQDCPQSKLYLWWFVLYIVGKTTEKRDFSAGFTELRVKWSGYPTQTLFVPHPTFMGFRSPSISIVAIFLYQEAARFLLMFRKRLTASSSSLLGRSNSRSTKVLVKKR